MYVVSMERDTKIDEGEEEQELSPPIVEMEQEEGGGGEEEEVEEVCTLDGSVDRHGRPSIRGKSGGWRVGSLLLINQGLTSLAFFGVGVNLVLFMNIILRQDNVDAANSVSKWIGTTYIFSLVGAFLSDSYWGRYKTCVIFQFVFITGLVTLSLSCYLLLLRPCVPGDGVPNCEPPTNMEVAIFYLAIYQIALGNGGYQPSVTTFGADQFDEEDEEESKSKVAFFSYFYVANNIGSLFSNTVLVYVEDKGEWVIGFWISSGAAILGLFSFLAGYFWYRHFKPGGNPVMRISHVAVASARKWDEALPSNEENLYELDRKEYSAIGSRKILHTPDFRFLDKAAVLTVDDFKEEDKPPNPWRLCTVTQVEEVKCVLRLLPIWLCTVMYSVVYTQMASIFVEQASVMNTKISTFNIPPASMSIFEILSVSGAVFLYRMYLRTTTSTGLTELQRMGVGLVLSSLAMVTSGLVESQRLKHAINDEGSSLSILWQIPPYVMIGVSEIFMYVGQLEFFNRQAPDGLKSFGSALYVLSMALGNYVSSLIVTVVMQVTTGRGRDGVGWIPDNLNEGHLDFFFYLLASLTAVDIFVFVFCAKWYRCIHLEGHSSSSYNVVNVSGEEEIL